ncbi:MAG: spherulation-specific family 4 protein [Rubripirellula sp.]
MIPAYANPCCEGGPKMWDALVQTAKNPDRNFDLIAIFNPASGPGTDRDLNFLSDDGKDGVVVDFRSAGGKLYGYVSTRYCERDDAAIQQDIDGYLTDKSLYQGHLDGIFFEELSNDLAKVSRYRNWVAYIKSIDATIETIANPGIGVTRNPTNQTRFSTMDYVSVFDGLMSFEHHSSNYTDRFSCDPLIHQSNKLRFHALHSQPEWDAHWIRLAKKNHSNYLFVTDDHCENLSTDNPYDQLPSYWSQMIQDVIRTNQSR